MSGSSRPLHDRKPAAGAMRDLHSIDPVLARVYATRGVHDVTDLDYGLQQLAPVGSLDGIDQAVDLLLQHRDKQVMVIGDFDLPRSTIWFPIVLRLATD